MRRILSYATSAALCTAVVALSAGCPDVDRYDGTEEFAHLPHSLLPPAPSSSDPDAPAWHLGAGEITGTGPEQPVAFPHYTHVTTLQMQCEYCHDVARKSIHAGVPHSATCMNCHTNLMTDRPEIQKLKAYWDKGEPVPWKKVHDLQDFVQFNHGRHVNAGVNCTECHGQVGLQGQTSTWSEHDAEGNVVTKTGVRYPMVRETTLQMGWCLDCHASHPSIDKNYCADAEPGCEAANRRRAEIKDCWTCHK